MVCEDGVTRRFAVAAVAAFSYCSMAVLRLFAVVLWVAAVQVSTFLLVCFC